MTLEDEHDQLIRRRENLLKERKINAREIEKLNKTIDYYIWMYNSLLYEENDYNESVLSYRRMLNRSKERNLLDFPFFDTNFDRYYLSRIQHFEQKILEVSKKRESVDNLITIKKSERKALVEKNKEIDFYIEQNDENMSEKKVLVKEKIDK